MLYLAEHTKKSGSTMVSAHWYARIGPTMEGMAHPLCFKNPISTLKIG
jgi:hypothetical protein